MGGTSKISLLRIALAAAICLFATAPVFLHHTTGAGAGMGAGSSSPHQHLLNHLRVSSRRIGKTSTLETIKYELGNDGETFNFAYEEDDHLVGKIDHLLPPDIGGAGRSLLLHALEPRRVWDDEIDPEYEEERCRKYFIYENQTKTYYDYNKNTTQRRPPRRRRRLFLGSLVADDSWHALGAIAMETYGVYAAVAFVESNRTQMGTPRDLRFVNGTAEHTLLVESHLFGPNTPVLLDQYSHEDEIDGGGLIREHMQRSAIIDLWKRAGMTADDVGVLTDADETPTRDFLRAVQTCDMPQFDPSSQNCHTAKVIVSSMVFEGSPECMTVTRKWMHPDLIHGKCIDGIGDDEYRLDDSQRQRKYAWRKREYTHKYSNYSGWPQEKKTYPLWNAADFRRDQGGAQIMFEEVDYLPFGFGHTGYHFHNYFETTARLRNKYVTYGHPVKDAANLTVSEMHPDLDTMVDCVLGRSTADNKYNTLSTRLSDFEGRVPIAYGMVEGYTLARHVELREILKGDEMGHASTWHDTARSKDWYENIPK